MATTEGTVLDTTDQEFIYNGHPQPTVDERLFEAKNWLADEDPDRCLQFDTKIVQILDLVEYIQTQNLPHDDALLHDVKVMLGVHHSWDKRRKTKLPAADEVKDDEPLPYYPNRLISAEDAIELEQDCDDIGLINQTREDHAPFTVQPANDHVDFLKHLRMSGGVDDLATLDLDTNLIRIEAEAYRWASRDPAMIPKWMHTSGIPIKGIRHSDLVPVPPVPQLQHSALALNRPDRGFAPPYVLTMEKKINDLLVKGNKSPMENALLEEIQDLYAPASVRNMRQKYIRLLDAYELAENLGTATPDLAVTRDQAGDDWFAAQNTWINSFNAIGFYFIVREIGPRGFEVDQPGVIYLDHGHRSPEHSATIKAAQGLVAKWVAAPATLHALEKAQLHNLLSFSFTTEHKRIRKALGHILLRAGVKTEQDLIGKDKNDWDVRHALEEQHETNLQNKLLTKSPTVQYLRPGELREENESTIYIPWDITSLSDFILPRNPDVLVTKDQITTEHDIMTKEEATLWSEINLKLAQKADYNLDGSGDAEFIKALISVAPPQLRNYLAPFTYLFDNQDKPIREGYRWWSVLHREVERMWNAWVEGLGRKVTIKRTWSGLRPRMPGVLYIRREPKTGEDTTAIAAALTQLVRLDLTYPDTDDFWSNLLQRFRDYLYPALLKKQVDIQNELEPNRKNRMSGNFKDAFKRWIGTLRGCKISIRQYQPIIDPDNDPSVVYFNKGPLTSEYAIDEITAQALRQQLKTALPDPGNPFDDLLHNPILQRLPTHVQQVVVKCKDSSPERVVASWHIKFFMKDLQGPVTFFSADIGYNSSLLPGGSQYSDAQSDGTSSEQGKSSLYYHDALAVDLEPMLPKIMALQAEINRLLVVVGKSWKTLEEGPQSSDANANTDLFQLIPQRLHALLTQFASDKLCSSDTEYTQLRQELQVAQPEDQPALRSRLRIASRQYISLYVHWVRSLVATTVRIQTSSKAERVYMQKLLKFQPLETGVAGAFQIVAPSVITTDIDVASSVLLRFGSTTRTPIPTYPLDGNAVLAWEAEVNELLRNWRNSDRKWTWDESERLLALLRDLMPADLLYLDSALLEFDAIARSQALSSDEALKFWALWGRWNTEYYGWLQSLPGEVHIALDNFSPKDYMHSRNGMPWDVTPSQRLKTLPLLVQKDQQRLNEYLAGSDAMTAFETERLRTLLSTMWRPITKQFRRSVINEFEKEPGSFDAEEPENTTLMQVIVAELNATYLERLRNISPVPRVIIIEDTPGMFSIDIGNHANIPSFSSTTLETEFVQNAVATHRPKFLDDSRKAFLDLAMRVRTNVTLTSLEAEAITQHLIGIPMSHSIKLRTELAQLLAKFGVQGLQNLNQAQIQLLIQADTLFLWLTWGSAFPSLRAAVLSLGSIVPTEPLDILNSPQSVGFGLHLSLPIIGPPNSTEVKAVEIEINNLLIKIRDNASEVDVHRLEFILLALLDSPLKLLVDRIKRLEAEFLHQRVLSTNNALALIKEQQNFATKFQEFKNNIPNFGVFLDHWWYSAEAIQEACSRSRAWQAMQPAALRDPPIIQTLDPAMTGWHQVYADLISYVDGDLVDTPEVAQRLFFPPLNDPLTVLRDRVIAAIAALNQARNLIPATQNSTTVPAITKSSVLAEDEDKRHLALIQALKHQFVNQYMTWFTSLTTSELQSFRLNASAGAQAINYRPKAERRGIQRAAIELALNTLATNQEQERPDDRFRIVRLPGVTQRSEVEVPLCQALEPEDQKVELDPFDYTTKLIKFRELKDFQYENASLQFLAKYPQEALKPPHNYMGPIAAANGADFKAATLARQAELAQIYALLYTRSKEAPRPFLDQLCLIAAMGMKSGFAHPLYDTTELKQVDLDLLLELAEESWSNPPKPYVASFIPDLLTNTKRLSSLQDFEQDLLNLYGLPFWKPDLANPPTDLLPSDPQLFVEILHDPDDPSTMAWTAEDVKEKINAKYLRAGNVAVVKWGDRDLIDYLRSLHTIGRIHFDYHDTDPLQRRVSRIPPNGHPEHKYVQDIAKLDTSPGVVFNTTTNKFEVQYDAAGLMGPPMVQPNMYEHFSSLAFRLGRDIKSCLKVARNQDVSISNCVKKQQKAMDNAEKMMDSAELQRQTPSNIRKADLSHFTLEEMAKKLHKIAPELARDAGYDFSAGLDTMNDLQAGTLLQMQILEEANNNWEPRFPEHENLWDFAADRLEAVTKTLHSRDVLVKPRPKHFFHIDKFPVTPKTTLVTKTPTGPQIQEKPKPKAVETAQERVQRLMEEALEPKNQVRWIRGQSPYFPFGETRYQEQYLSYRMTQELKDVPEFQVIPRQPHRSSLMARMFRRRSASGSESDDDNIDHTALPPLPPTWFPDNVSLKEKYTALREAVMKTPGVGFPDPSILENYYTMPEIWKIQSDERAASDAMDIAEANADIEKHTGKKRKALTYAELASAQQAIGIDPNTGMKRTKPVPFSARSTNTPVTRGRRTRFGLKTPVKDPTPVSTGLSRLFGGQLLSGGPARNIRSKSPTKSPTKTTKRNAGDQPDGQKSPKKKK